jgi:hypothetical protein
LKAPKKAPKAELDEEDKAFQEKQKAGVYPAAYAARSYTNHNNRCKGKVRAGGKSLGEEGASQYWQSGYQEERKEMSDSTIWSVVLEMVEQSIFLENTALMALRGYKAEHGIGQCMALGV